jgi:microcystin synthetase protein McyE
MGQGRSWAIPIEMEALAGLCHGRPPTAPLVVGSVKTNIGHLEAAAGIAGLIKVVLALQHEVIPPHLHFKQPNPYIPWDELEIVVPTKRRAWAKGAQARLAGVSAFGFSGTNAHVVLEEAPAVALDAAADERPLHILALSAKTPVALQQLIQRYVHYLAAHPSAPLADICYSANMGRTHFNHRLSVLAASTQELYDRLTGGSLEQMPPSFTPPLITFLFTGHGTPYAGMGRELYEIQPVFRQLLDRCDELLKDYRQPSLRAVWYPEVGSTSQLDEATSAQPALFALEYALAELWRSWGIVPDYLLGHGLGEYAAACVAGVFEWSEALPLIVERSRMMQASPDGRANAWARYQELAAKMTYHRPRYDMISTVTGTRIMDEIASPAYWINHLLQEAVPFQAGINHWFQLLAERCQGSSRVAVMEMGPEPMLLELGQRWLTRHHPMAMHASHVWWLPTLRQGGGDWQHMMQSLSTLYDIGAPIAWHGVEHGHAGRWLSLPTYPFQRQLHRSAPSAASPGTPAISSQSLSHQPLIELLAQGQVTEVIERLMQLETFSDDEQRLLPKLLERLLSAPPPAAAAALLSPQDIYTRLKPQMDILFDTPERHVYEALLPLLETLSLNYVVQALRQLGWRFQPGQRFTTAAMASELGVMPQQQRFLHRLLEILAETGNLQRQGDVWECVSVPVLSTAAETVEALRLRYPEADVEWTLVQRAGSRLAPVLRGEQYALQVLFPDEDLGMATRLYQDALGARVMNALVRQTIVAALENWPPGRQIRILELGAGTGGTTASILPVLTTRQVAYTFSDVSPIFLQRAREKFRAYPFVRYALLDVEAPPPSEDVTRVPYDLIIAANVLHATQSLHQTLQRVRTLLAPAGLLVLLESTTSRRWVDLLAGALDGWWRFTDFDLRPSHPLLSAPQWQQLLDAETSGFQTSVRLDPAAWGASVYGQTVMVAQADAEPARAPAEQAAWADQPVKDQPGFLVAYVQERVAHVLDMPASELDRHRPLTASGLDSLMATSLCNQLAAELGVRLDVASLLDGLSIAGLVSHVEVCLAQARSSWPATQASHPTLNEQLTDAEVEQQLLSLLSVEAIEGQRRAP